MFDTGITMIIVDLFAIVVITMIFLIKLSERKTKDGVQPLIICILGFFDLYILVDELLRVIQDSNMYSLYFKLGYLIKYLLIAVICVLFSVVIYRQSRKQMLEKILAGMNSVLFVGFISIIIVNYFVPFLFTITNNTVAKLPSYYIFSLIMAVVGIADLLIILHSKNSIADRLFCVIYVSLVSICVILEFANSDYSFTPFAIFVSIFAYFIYNNSKKSKLIAEQEIALTNAHVELLLSQIQPHFLYNTLSSIGYICEKDPALASKAIDDFSFYLRANLSSIGANKLLPFKDELKHCEYYINLESLRFKDKIKVKYDLKEKDFLVPTLTPQPIIENAIRHGITKKKNGGTITIRTFKEGNYYVIVVSDNGVGFDKDEIKETSVGIKNITSRLNSYGGSIDIDSVVGKGTKVTVMVKGE